MHYLEKDKKLTNTWYLKPVNLNFYDSFPVYISLFFSSATLHFFLFLPSGSCWIRSQTHALSIVTAWTAASRLVLTGARGQRAGAYMSRSRVRVLTKKTRGRAHRIMSSGMWNVGESMSEMRPWTCARLRAPGLVSEQARFWARLRPYFPNRAVFSERAR